MSVKYIVGNWKMNGSLKAAQDFAAALSTRLRAASVTQKIILCPPFPYLLPFREQAGPGLFNLGGQDCSPYPAGPHTGDVSAEMLFDVGCRFTLIGHSERRSRESNEEVRKKGEAALHAGLIPVLCVGETLAQRQAQAALKTVETQLLESGPSKDIIVAYEPVWAIGTGATPTPTQIEEMHCHLRTTLKAHVPGGEKIPLLYGGSVTPQNAASLLAIPHVEGVLVGGASLSIDDFWEIIENAKKAGADLA